MAAVVLTDERGNALGLQGRAEAHTGNGLLHKAFSVFVFQRGRLLMQKRHEDKLFGGLWGNSCCSHPREHEDIVEAGKRRLQEELGFLCDLREAGSFVYRAEDSRGRGVEHERDTVLVGEVDDVEVQSDPKEVSEWKWMEMKTLQRDLEEHSESYAPWLNEALTIVLKHYGI